jgi:hypothetical protein
LNPGDVVHGCPPGGRVSRPGLLVEAFALQRGEDRFGKGVVPALAGATDRQGDLQPDGGGGEVVTGVLLLLILDVVGCCWIGGCLQCSQSKRSVERCRLSRST